MASAPRARLVAAASASRIEPTTQLDVDAVEVVGEPVDRSSSTITARAATSPLVSRRHRLDPMKPAPPVTSTRTPRMLPTGTRCAG